MIKTVMTRLDGYHWPAPEGREDGEGWKRLILGHTGQKELGNREKISSEQATL